MKHFRHQSQFLNILIGTGILMIAMTRCIVIIYDAALIVSLHIYLLAPLIGYILTRAPRIISIRAVSLYLALLHYHNLLLSLFHSATLCGQACI
jgi:hypothetical protein